MLSTASRRPVARRMPSGETNRKQQAAWTDQPTELNECSSLVDVMEYSHSGDDVERILLDLTGEEISHDVVDVIARLSSQFDARCIGIEPNDGGHPLPQPP